LGIFIDIIFPPHYGPGFDSASGRNEYQEYLLGGKGSRCVGLTALTPSSTDHLEILGTSTSWNPKVMSRPVWDSFTYLILLNHAELAFINFLSPN